MLVVGGCRLVKNPSKSHSGINCHHTFYIFLRYQTTRGFGWFVCENEGILGFATAWKAQEEAEQLQQKRQVDLPRAVHLMMGWFEGFLRGERTRGAERSQQYLVGGFEHLDYFSIYWEQSSQLTNSIIFQRGWLNHQPDNELIAKCAKFMHPKIIGMTIPSKWRWHVTSVFEGVGWNNHPPSSNILGWLQALDGQAGLRLLFRRKRNAWLWHSEWLTSQKFDASWWFICMIFLVQILSFRWEGAFVFNVKGS